MPARFVCCADRFEKGLIEMFSGVLIALAGKIMHLQSFIFCATCLALSSVCAVAGSAAGGGAQIAPMDNASASTYKVTDTSVGASARDSAGASTSQSSASSSTNASSTDGSSSNGSASSNGSGSSAVDGSSRGSKDSNNLSTEIAHEKVIDTGDKPIEEQKTTKTESKDKTFKPGLLDAISDISNVSVQKDQAAVANEKDSQPKGKSAAKEEQDDSKKKN